MPRGRQPKKQKYTPKSEQFIRALARDLRRLLSIDHEYAPDLLKALHHLNNVYPRFKLKVVQDDDLPDAEAKAYCKACILKVRAGILNAISRYGDPRARWTIAHELGHIALQHPRGLFRMRPEQPISSEDEELENEADIFASEFLIPSHLAGPCRRPGEIATRFQVSIGAAKLRQMELGRETHAPDEGGTSHTRTAAREIANNPEPLVLSPALQADLPPMAKPFVFVAMAFTPEMTRLYLEILKPTIEEFGIICQRGDEIASTVAVAIDIERAISLSRLVIAEISDFNPNVMHEIGLAQSLKKPTVIICASSIRMMQAEDPC
jgi:Zn-dependent peptidase ImmA (M78 family)